ncbi:hypothetical protein niasHT_015410 [Heterodera trifolii]|uniref:Uncharacterized protein n=1 Tax=Heterodera trifolii TaxID=157864 RepID=A0ABD2KZX2_9BILA
MTATSTTIVSELEEEEKEQKIREIVVLPAPEIIDARQGTAARDANEALEEMAKAMREKTRDCAKVGDGEKGKGEKRGGKKLTELRVREREGEKGVGERMGERNSKGSGRGGMSTNKLLPLFGARGICDPIFKVLNLLLGPNWKSYVAGGR